MLNRRQLNSSIDALGHLEPFRNCTRAELSEIARNSCEIEIEEGRNLCEEGEPGREAFVIVDGVVHVTIGGEHVAILGPGSLVGEMALLEGRPRVATVTAITPARVLAFSAKEFNQVMGDVPTTARHVATTLSHRLREAEEPPGHAPKGAGPATSQLDSTAAAPHYDPNRSASCDRSSTPSLPNARNR